MRRWLVDLRAHRPIVVPLPPYDHTERRDPRPGERKPTMIEKYGKSVAAFLTALAMTAVPLWSGDHRFDASETVIVATAFVNLAMVWLAPLVPGARWTKTAAAAVLAALEILAVAVLNGIDANDVVMIAVAVLGALGVAVAPAVSGTGTGRAVAVGWGTSVHS